MSPARRAMVSIHRWFGLVAALFLFVAGATGAVISWDHELDEWLNPAFYQAHGGSSEATGLERALALADRVEALHPEVRVGYVPLAVEPKRALQMSVNPRIDPTTQAPFDVGFNQLALDPKSGEIQAARTWGEVSLARENLLPFLYKLHYTMHIPDGFGLELGALLMGLIAIAWTIDCFVALWLSFPNRKAWRKSLAFRWRQGGYRLNFDLHRSGGVWLWMLLLMLAFTGISLNLGSQVVRPLVAVLSPLSETPLSSRAPAPLNQPLEPAIARRQIVAMAQDEAQKRGISAPPGGLFYSPSLGVYGVGFFAPGHAHGDGSLGNPWLYFDGKDGRALGALLPGAGSAGDVFMQAQLPLHSGRMLGLFGRAIVSLLGLAVAVLSVTGIVIWARKRRARMFAASRGKEGSALQGGRAVEGQGGRGLTDAIPPRPAQAGPAL